MKTILLYRDDDERRKWYNEYHRIANSRMTGSWRKLKPIVIEFLACEGYKFRKNASWFVLIKILLELCLKTKRLLIGHDAQLNDLLNDKAKEEN